VKRRTLTWHGVQVDFFTDAQHPPTHHYTVTRVASSSILGWGQRETESECEAEARTAVRQLMKRMGKEKAPNAAISQGAS
jgi:hypothetical protein